MKTWELKTVIFVSSCEFLLIFGTFPPTTIKKNFSLKIETQHALEGLRTYRVFRPMVETDLWNNQKQKISCQTPFNNVLFSDSQHPVEFSNVGPGLFSLALWSWHNTLGYWHHFCFNAYLQSAAPLRKNRINSASQFTFPCYAYSVLSSFGKPLFRLNEQKHYIVHTGVPSGFPFISRPETNKKQKLICCAFMTLEEALKGGGGGGSW